MPGTGGLPGGGHQMLNNTSPLNQASSDRYCSKWCGVQAIWQQFGPRDLAMRVLQWQMKVENAKPFRKKMGPRELQTAFFRSLGFSGAPFNRKMHQKSGHAIILQWSCPPSAAEALVSMRTLDELPIKTGRRYVLLFKEKEAKTKSEVSIPPNEPSCH